MKALSMTTKSKLTNSGLLLLRLFLGLALLFSHGLGKWSNLFGGDEIRFADPFGIGAAFSLALAVFAEVICAILLTFGLLTRWALIPLIILMAVAIVTVHIPDGFAGMEKALLYGVGFITLLLTGPGKYSVDALFKRNLINQQ